MITIKILLVCVDLHKNYSPVFSLTLSALMHFYGKQDIQNDLEEIDTENNPDVEEKTACTLVALLQRPEVWRPLLVACALQLIQQFSGINAVSAICTQ